MEELRGRIQGWSLESDDRLLRALSSFSNTIVSRTQQINDELETLGEETRATRSQLQNTFNRFLMLQSGQFIENRVVRDQGIAKEIAAEQKHAQHAQANTSAVDDQLSAQQQATKIIDTYKKAMHLGMEAMQHTVPQSVLASVLKSQQDSIEAGIAPTLPKCNRDAYNNKPLPYIIGTAEFTRHEDLGLYGAFDDHVFYNIAIEDEKEDETQVQMMRMADGDGESDGDNDSSEDEDFDFSWMRSCASDLLAKLESYYEPDSTQLSRHDLRKFLPAVADEQIMDIFEYFEDENGYDAEQDYETACISVTQFVQLLTDNDMDASGAGDGEQKKKKARVESGLAAALQNELAQLKSDDSGHEDNDAPKKRKRKHSGKKQAAAAASNTANANAFAIDDFDTSSDENEEKRGFFNDTGRKTDLKDFNLSDDEDGDFGIAAALSGKPKPKDKDAPTQPQAQQQQAAPKKTEDLFLTSSDEEDASGTTTSKLRQAKPMANEDTAKHRTKNDPFASDSDDENDATTTTVKPTTTNTTGAASKKANFFGDSDDDDDGQDELSFAVSAAKKQQKVTIDPTKLLPGRAPPSAAQKHVVFADSDSGDDGGNAAAQDNRNVKKTGNKKAAIYAFGDSDDEDPLFGGSKPKTQPSSQTKTNMFEGSGDDDDDADPLSVSVAAKTKPAVYKTAAAPTVPRKQSEHGEMSRTGIKIDVNKLKLGMQSHLTVAQIKARTAGKDPAADKEPPSKAKAVPQKADEFGDDLAASKAKSQKKPPTAAATKWTSRVDPLADSDSDNDVFSSKPKPKSKKKSADPLSAMFGDDENEQAVTQKTAETQSHSDDKGEMSKSGIKIDVNKLKMGMQSHLTVAQIKARKAETAQPKSHSLPQNTDPKTEPKPTNNATGEKPIPAAKSVKTSTSTSQFFDDDDEDDALDIFSSKKTKSKKKKQTTDLFADLDEDDDEQSSKAVAVSKAKKATAIADIFGDDDDDDDFLALKTKKKKSKKTKVVESLFDSDDDGDGADTKPELPSEPQPHADAKQQSMKSEPELFDDEEDDADPLAVVPKTTAATTTKAANKSVFDSDAEDNVDVAPALPSQNNESGEMSKSGVKIDVNKLKLGMQSHLTVAQIKARKAKTERQPIVNEAEAESAPKKRDPFGDDGEFVFGASKQMESTATKSKAEAEPKSRANAEKGQSSNAVGDDAVGNDPLRLQQPKTAAATSAAETKSEQTRKSPAPKHKMNSKLAAKFGHLNINPMTLKVGAAPPKLHKKTQELDQSATMNKATISRTARRKRTKKKVVMEEDNEADGTARSSSLFSASSVAEEHKQQATTTAQSVFAERREFASKDDIDADDALVSAAIIPTQSAKPKKHKENLFDDSDNDGSDDDDDPFGADKTPAISTSADKTFDAKETEQTTETKPAQATNIFTQPDIGGDMTLFDGDDDDVIGKTQTTSSPAEASETQTATTAKTVEAEKVEFDPLADSGEEDGDTNDNNNNAATDGVKPEQQTPQESVKEPTVPVEIVKPKDNVETVAESKQDELPAKTTENVGDQQTKSSNKKNINVDALFDSDDDDADKSPQVGSVDASMQKSSPAEATQGSQKNAKPVFNLFDGSDDDEDWGPKATKSNLKIDDDDIDALFDD